MEKSVLFRLSESSLTDHSHFTSSQNLVDGMVRSSFEQVADWKTFFPIVGGVYVNRWVKLGLLSTSPHLFNKIPLLVRGASVVALGGEAAAFEVAHRGIVSLTQPSSQIPPTLWTWSGSHGLKEGWLHSVTNFGAIKVFGAWGEGQNLVFRHGAQALGMVAGHQLVYLAGWSEKPEGSFAEQIFQAEGVNLQLAGGMALFHVGAPGLHALERGWDLALRVRESGTGFPRPHFPEGETPLLQGAGKSPSSFQSKNSPSREGREIDRYINLMVPVDGDGNGGAGDPGGKGPSSEPPRPPWTAELGEAKGLERLSKMSLGERKPMEDRIEKAVANGFLRFVIEKPQESDWERIEVYYQLAKEMGYELGPIRRNTRHNRLEAPIQKIGGSLQEALALLLERTPSPSEKPLPIGEAAIDPNKPAPPPTPEEGRRRGEETLANLALDTGDGDYVRQQMETILHDAFGHGRMEWTINPRGPSSKDWDNISAFRIVAEGLGYEIGAPHEFEFDPAASKARAPLRKIGERPVREMDPMDVSAPLEHPREPAPGGAPAPLAPLEPAPEAPRAAISEPPVADRHAALPPPPSEPVGGPAPYRAPLPTLVIAEPVIRSADAEAGRATVPSPPPSSPVESGKMEMGRSADEVLTGNNESVWRPLGEAYLQASEDGYRAVYEMGAKEVLAKNLNEAAQEGKLELTGDPTDPQRRDLIAAYRVVAQEERFSLGDFVFYGIRKTHVAEVKRLASPPPLPPSHGDPWMEPVPPMKLDDTSQNFTPESLTLKLAPDVPPGLVTSQVGQFGREIVINVGEMPSHEVLEIEGNSLAIEISYEPNSSFVDGKNFHILRIPSATQQGPLNIYREDPAAKPNEFQVANLGSAPITISLPEGRGRTIESLQDGLFDEGGTIAFGLQRLVIKGLPVPPKSTPSSSKKEHAPSPSTPEDGRQIGEEFLASTQRAVLIGADPDAWVPLGEKFIREQEGNYRAAHGAGVKEILSRDLNEAGFLGQIRLVGDPKDVKTLELLAAYRVMAVELGIHLGDFTYHPPEGEKEGSFEAKISEIPSADSVPPPSEGDTTAFVRGTEEPHGTKDPSPSSPWEAIAEELVVEFGEGMETRMETGDRPTDERVTINSPPRKATLAMATPPSDEIKKEIPIESAPLLPPEAKVKGLRFPDRLRAAFSDLVARARPTPNEETTVKAIAMTIRYRAPSLAVFAEHQKNRITAEGFFLKTDQTHEVGALIKFDIKIYGDETILKGGGKVEWRRTQEEATPENPAGMQIQFLRLDSKSQDNLRRILARKSSL